MISRILQKNAISIIFATGALCIVLFLRFSVLPEGKVRPARVDRPETDDVIPAYQSVIIANGKSIPVSIADTDETRQEGLSGTPSLTPGTGKLFIFDTPGTYAFWMKDMYYPIDIVWIDSSWKVVDITHALTPESYPATFYTADPIHYVLEINADEVSTDNLSVGTQLHLEK